MMKNIITAAKQAKHLADIINIPSTFCINVQ